MGKAPMVAGGTGGPAPVDPSKQKPVNPPVQLPTIPNPLADFQAAVVKGIQVATSDMLGAGEVLIGVALVIAGLLLATGQLGRAGRAGVAVGRTAGAARSFIR